MHKQLIGKQLYHAIATFLLHEAATITNFMFEMDNSELVLLMEEQHGFRKMVCEAKEHLQAQKIL